ncbi:hypothetical protein TL16_g02829 [Triparma laevis f. inornata]|uniref:mannose-6-phosphate isomerase n=1 Tax=Triparma laevis f. inornata TaxID=1714386 RepID=A0A9W6ZS10_9STRA|nr:hypothetical protein TL16_g02829 [Triparma laevis f. inornata]
MSRIKRIRGAVQDYVSQIDGNMALNWALTTFVVRYYGIWKEVETEKKAWGKMSSENPLVKRIYDSQCAASSLPPSDLEKYAEIWLGTHPNAPSLLIDSDSPTEGSTSNSTSLNDYITSSPTSTLGTHSSTSNIPYLLKILSINKVLSIQSHPDSTLAAQLHASNPDVYKTPCHKPEMAIALTDFKAMIGFRPLSLLWSNLQSYSEVESLVEIKSPTDEIILKFNEMFPGDCGVLSPIFLNVIDCTPGQSIFVSSNTPHAYISGEIVECMARSDNVIRCGLTPKFKDVEVLCGSLSYDCFEPVVSGGVESGTKGERVYRPPVEDFEVRVADFKEDTVVEEVDAGVILLCLEGGGVVKSGEEKVDIKFGEALFINAGTKLEVEVGEQGCKFVRALRNVGSD